MTSHLANNTKSPCSAALAWLPAAALLLAFGSGALAQADAPVDPTDHEQVHANIMARASVHQSCINGVMSTLETAVVKREQISTDCASSLDDMVAAFPEDIRPMIRAISERRMETVLSALQEAETITREATSDVSEVIEDLSALDASAALDPS